MSMIRSTFLASVLILSGCGIPSDSPPPKKVKGASRKEVKAPESKLSEVQPLAVEPQVKVQVEMESVSRQAKITASNSEGQVISAENNYNHTWSVNGDNAVGGIIYVDPVTKVAKYQSSSMSTPVHSMIVNPDGSVATTEFNSFGSKKTIVTDFSKNVTRIEVTNSPKDMLVAKKNSEGFWDIRGRDIAGKSIDGTLEIDPGTGFFIYKGSNGSFMYKESIPIDSVIAGMSLVKGELTEKTMDKELSDVSHRRSNLTEQTQDLLLTSTLQ